MVKFPSSEGEIQPDQLLITKLYLPCTRATLVSRPRLITRLNTGLERKLILISAPAGFGKTTLLCEWLTGRFPHPFNVAWLSLDEGDNDPTRFWLYIIAALQTLQPDLGENSLAQLHTSQPPKLEAILTKLLNELAAWPDHFVLVLDDYHLIQTPAIHQAFTFWLDHLPPKMHLVLTSRSDPPLPLARLRARDQLVEIRADDLRFTPTEAAAFLHQVMGLNLPGEDVAALDERTEGWVAGLQLAALSLQGQDPTQARRFITTFAGDHRYVLDYLGQEVLQQQSKPIQAFLLQTSILERLTAPLCDVVVGKDEEKANSSFTHNVHPSRAALILDQLERANLFLIPLDAQRRWYRYHHLFANFLRTQLEQAYPPEDIAQLHHRASLWYEQNGLIVAAIDHSLAAGDFERALNLIEPLAQDLIMRGEMAPLLKWLEVIPDEKIRPRPQLALFYAWVLLFDGQLDRTEVWLQTAVEVDPSPVIAGQVAAIRAFYTILQGDVATALASSQQALDLLPAGDPFLRGVAAVSAGISGMLEGDIITTARLFGEIAAYTRQSGNTVIAVMALGQMAELVKYQGQLRRSAEIYRQALALATLPDGQILPVAGTIHAGLASLAYEWNDLAAAQHHLDESFRLGEQMGQAGIFDSYMVELWLRQALSDSVGALGVIRRVIPLIQKFTPLGQNLLEALQTRLWLIQGNLADALNWAKVYRERVIAQIDADAPYHYHLEELEKLTLVRVRIAQGRFDSNPPALSEALQILQTLWPTAEKLDRGSSIIEIRLLQALAHQAQGNLPQAMAALEQALSLAEPEGFIRLFLDVGAPLAELLGRMNASREGARSGRKEYLHKLLTAFDAEKQKNKNAGEESGYSPPLPHSPAPPLVESLSERELEILRLIAAGRSNQEVAQTLFIAMGTVKKHLNNIYTKLGVRSRTQALAQARALNLL